MLCFEGEPTDELIRKHLSYKQTLCEYFAKNQSLIQTVKEWFAYFQLCQEAEVSGSILFFGGLCVANEKTIYYFIYL